jgi:hypothetical protein
MWSGCKRKEFFFATDPTPTRYTGPLGKGGRHFTDFTAGRIQCCKTAGPTTSLAILKSRLLSSPPGAIRPPCEAHVDFWVRRELPALRPPPDECRFEERILDLERSLREERRALRQADAFYRRLAFRCFEPTLFA